MYPARYPYVLERLHPGNLPLLSAPREKSVRVLGSTLLLILAGCARADPPELFVADPALLNDFTASLPSTGSSNGLEYAIVQGLAVLEGDILLGHVDGEGRLERSINTRGLARNDAFGRWPDGIVPYIAPDSNSPTQQVNIHLAIEHWMERSSITFVERTADNADQYPHYLRFTSSNSCASYVGMQGGEQPIMVSDGCTSGSIIHELGHALGLFHEHTRSDRDSFIQVDWDQIVDGKDINFKIQNVGTSNYGSYDYGSIMHYGEYFFSKSTQPTIIVPDGVDIGQRVELSEIDASSVDQMYATDIALLPPSDVQSDDGLEIGVTVFNQGELGAHELLLVVRLAADTQWKGVSGDSGWECMSHDEELRCTRATLEEGSESRFVLLADAGSGDAEDIRMLLDSRTHDTNTTNNSYNDNGSLSSEEPADTDPKSVDNSDEDEPSSSDEATPTSVPTVASAEPDNGSSGTTVEASAGGAVNGSLLLLMLGLFGLRRLDRASIAESLRACRIPIRRR